VTTLYRQLHNSKTHAQGNDPTCPLCIRQRRVSDEIAKVGARHLCEVKGPNEGSLSFYILPNGEPFIVQWFTNDEGFEIYCTISHTNSIDDTFQSLEKLAALHGPAPVIPSSITEPGANANHHGE
jgi:hypothetical protein